MVTSKFHLPKRRNANTTRKPQCCEINHNHLFLYTWSVQLSISLPKIFTVRESIDYFSTLFSSHTILQKSFTFRLIALIYSDHMLPVFTNTTSMGFISCMQLGNWIKVKNLFVTRISSGTCMIVQKASCVEKSYRFNM